MRFISWNLSYQHKITPKIDFLRNHINSETIIVLQEVVEHYVKPLNDFFEVDYNLFYSLSKREPSTFDGKERKLGVMVIVPKQFKVNFFDVLRRTPFPDRTTYLEIEVDETQFSLFGLHSLTGVDYKKTKSVQFYSLAEAVNVHNPDIVMIDANEPKIDHPEIEKIEYFNNRDKGNGAKTFFQELYKHELIDSFRSISRSQSIPLTVSHKVNKKFDRRYDFIFINQQKFRITNVEYLYEDSINAGSDHAMVICDVQIQNIL